MCACTAVGAAPAPLDSTFAPCGVHRLGGALYGRHLVTRVGGHAVQHAWRFRSYESVDQRHVLVVPCCAHVIALIVSHRYRPLFFPPDSLPPFPPSHRRALVNCIYIHMLLRSSEYSPPSIIFSVWMLHLLPAAIATMSASCDRPCIANLQKMAVTETREAAPTTGRRKEVGLAVRQATIELLAESGRQ